MALSNRFKIAEKWPGLIVWIVRVFHGFFGTGGCCRFEPSCSIYSAQAFRAQGVLKGAFLSVRRLLKCHPFGSYGFDPVGEKLR
jgi:hypothetical protein